VIIADTSGLLALFNRREPEHMSTQQVVKTRSELLVVSPYVVAELDYLLATRLGRQAELAVLQELAGDAYELAPFPAHDLQTAASVVEQYGDQDIGVTDASLVVLAARFETLSILTLDRRHFTVLKSLSQEHFELLPARG